MLEYGPLLMLAVIVIVLAIGFIPDSPEDALRKFQQECKANGMDFRETEAAIATRTAFARLRRIASDQCVSKSGNMGREAINEIASQVAIGLAAAHGREAAKSFIGWIETCPDEEILYDDARAARHRHTVGALRAKGLYPPPKNMVMHEDFKNAFRIV
ncbi:hypothetical protein [Mesorhizobium sp.]|uniref:hypothetical protein n=1 Tax=Mesorhizobium sp. TaxID=1871066 RepID=UPI000FE99201|nr:hypothetical protein [Mesorhizobium sp.]RWP80465.1 MAG: hypothetical protein EOR10_08455 [Mesorhizobium sp.]